MKNDLTPKLGLLSHRIDLTKQSGLNRNILAEFDEVQREAEQKVREKEIERLKHEQEILEILKSIERNTGDIAQIISLLQADNENQNEILSVLMEIQSIGLAKNLEEADSMYRTVMKKITQAFDDADAIDKLTGLSRVFFYSVKAHLKIKGIDIGDE